MSKTLINNTDLSGDHSEWESTQKELLNSTPIPGEEEIPIENKILSESLTEGAKTRKHFSVPETPIGPILPTGRKTPNSIPDTPVSSQPNKNKGPATRNTKNNKNGKITQDPTKDSQAINDLFNEVNTNFIDNE